MSDLRPASRLRQIITVSGRIATTLITGAIAVGLVILGSGVIATRASETPPPSAAEPTHVSSEAIMLEPGYTVDRAFIGQVVAAASIEAGFETGGTLAEVNVSEGDRFSTGDVLARLDTRALEAERNASVAARDALLAQLSLAERTAARAEGLATSGFASDQRLDEAQLLVAELRARTAETDAGIEAIDVALDKAVLRSPFAGEVGVRLADSGQTVGAGSPVLTLIEDTAPELHVGLPPALAATLTPGLEAQAEVLGEPVDIVLQQLRPDLDPVTRTQTAIFRLDVDAPVGQAARIVLQQDVIDPGAWVPLHALDAGIADTWTVLRVAQGIVEPVAVEILHTDDDRVFVRGGFDASDRLVTDGPHRLVAGQTVTE